MIRRRRAVMFGLVGSTLAVVCVLPFTGRAKTAAFEYTGVQIGSGKENVEFRVTRSARGANLRVRFDASDVSLVCKGDQFRFPEVDVPAISLPFRDTSVFQGQRYKREGNGDWTYYEVKGRLLGHRRAIGYLYYIEDPFDPPRAEDRSECSTGGQLYQGWKARRVG